MDAVDVLEEPEVGVARLASAWRQAAREHATGRGSVRVSESIDDTCAGDLARAVVNELCQRRDGGSASARQDDQPPHAAPGGPSRLSMAAARFGASRALQGGSVYDLVADLMALERAALRVKLADACAIHTTAECALLAGTAAFARAIAEAERKRVRDVRHDLTNAVGTVRNAILLMDEEPASGDREHFLEIARRNTVAAQQLVREHLSETSAIPAWLDSSRHVAVTGRPELSLADSARDERQELARAHERHDRNAELR